MSSELRQLQRLDDIAAALQELPQALALIGLGSSGRSTARMDEFSDLDFFVIVEPGSKPAFLQNLNWLSVIQPIPFAFQNTPDGYKFLFADGIFCECAIFEPEELKDIPFAPGRVIWKRAGVPDSLSQPRQVHTGSIEPSLEWLLGEALTNLYVGLCRYRRGEKLSAAHLIQGYAVDRLIQLIGRIEPPSPGDEDPYAPERRFEQRYPGYITWLKRFNQGYNGSPSSARAILEFIKLHYSIDSTMENAILALCQESLDDVGTTHA